MRFDLLVGDLALAPLLVGRRLLIGSVGKKRPYRDSNA
jgi:hypothetical protein